MGKILFICLGNVCRSQMAEGFYNHFTNSKDAFSAGIATDAPYYYKHPIKTVVDAMAEEGIDVSKKLVKIVNQEMVDQAERIIVMCGDACPGYLTNSGKVTYWDVDDPGVLPLEFMKRSRDIIKEKVKEII